MMIVFDYCLFYCLGSISSDDSLSFESLSYKERKRQHHIHELISTEESYVEDMSIVLDVSSAFSRLTIF